MPDAKTYRAGSSVEDYCRACKADRMHAVIAVDAGGQPIRVACGFCRSEHNYRGGPRTVVAEPSRPASPPLRSSAPSRSSGAAPKAGREAFPLVSDRERSAPPVMLPDDTKVDLEMLLRRIIREETGLTPVAPADKWRGGSLVLRPGTPGLQEKTWPIETFFHKVVMLRNRLRTLEQQVNASDLPDEIKVRLQGYVTGCYGSLTSFNLLFADEDDQFQGSSAE
jgi:hypothetical protein